VEAHTAREAVFLFSDIEGSTRLWESQPEEMRSALERHDSILGKQIETTGGEVVKATGDGVMAVFDDGASAIDAAMRIQLGLSEQAWSTTGAIKVRIGIHRGETQVRGDDYFGPTVNRTARLMAAGHGGQTLISSVVATELAGEQRAGLVLRDLGQHRLKDLSEPEHIFEVTTPGLSGTFPPLATLDVTPNNLPTQTSSFLGRDRELAEIRNLIDQSASRLVTLVGPGGTGKTRLALQAAAEQVDRYREGVFFVDLSTETDIDESFANITRVVGIDSATDESALDALKRGLADRATLLILDNLEQIETIGLSIDELLQACPGVGALATSREPLRVRSEQLYPIDPLSIPTIGRGGVSVDEVIDSESAQLFAERAAQNIPNFSIEEDNAALVASICVQLDGLPLALELAAARLRIFSLRELDERLSRQLDVLRGGAHDLPTRQKTLRDTIEWSYDLLNNSERDLLKLLAVFAGATVSDAEDVAVSAQAVADPLDDLASLVDKSLVRKTESRSGVSRFALLETIRHFAIERSEKDSDRHETWKQAHAAHFADVASLLANSFAGPDRDGARQRLTDEIENLQIAWGFWRDRRELDRLHQLFDAMWMLYDAEGWYQGAILLAEDLLDTLTDQPESTERTREQIALETSLARARMLIRGYTEEGEMAFMDAMAHAEASGAAPQLFPVLRSLASFYTLRGDLDKAMEVGEQLLAIAEDADDPTLAVDANLVYGVSKAFTTTLGDGLPYIDRAVEAFDPSEMGSERFRLGPHSGIVSLTTSAFLLAMQGFPEQAAARTDRALRDANELGHSYSKAYALYHVAFFKLTTQDLDSVAQHAAELLALANQYDYQIWRALAMVLLGVVKALKGDPSKGMAEIEHGIEIYQRLPTPPVFWGPLLQLRAPVAAMTGDIARALEMIDEAVALTSDPPNGLLGEMLITQGDILLMADRTDDASISFRESVEVATTFETRFVELRALTRLARLDGDAWREQLGEVYRKLTEGFDMPDLVAARQVLGLEETPEKG
jgi:predicted ATPase/class 3 adenylate cyclase